MKQRTSAVSEGARSGHFWEIQLQALICPASCNGTTKPVPRGARSSARAGNVRWTDAYPDDDTP
jgi:hypothetical protein